jgi:hypothetical protein
LINLLISLINLLIKPEPQKIEIDFGSKPIVTTTAMTAMTKLNDAKAQLVELEMKLALTDILLKAALARIQEIEDSMNKDENEDEDEDEDEDEENDLNLLNVVEA